MAATYQKHAAARDDAEPGTGKQAVADVSGIEVNNRKSRRARARARRRDREADDVLAAEVQQEATSTRRLEPEQMPAELYQRWIHLSNLAGSAEAVDVLQDIVRSTSGGEVRSELFHALFPFDLDGFQLEALDALGARKNVIVSAPTGSGKTVAGELAIYYALALGLRVFYTTPLKALSNQKFSDFRRRFGAERVGLLTGDSSYNREAQVCVMTTEVFRNMLYDSAAGIVGGEGAAATLGPDELKDVFAVVFDEFHYMNDRDRGTVWEESVISCPRHVLLVALSATMANVQDIAGWMDQTHGPTELVMSDFRPVPLRYWFANNRGIYPLFKDRESGPGARNGATATHAERVAMGKQGGRKGNWGAARQLPDRLKINPELEAMHQEEMHKRVAAERGPPPRGGRGGERGGGDSASAGGKNRASRDWKGGGGGGGGGGRTRGVSVQREVPSYPYLVRCLARRDLLPAIVFVFSRAGCDKAAREVWGGGGSLLQAEESEVVRAKVEAFRAANPQVPFDEDRAELLTHGIAAHHAGMLPAYKSLVEELFIANLCKVVFATETLAAGVNMPARSTVISVLSKRGDTGIMPLLPSQLLQMAGRAGRRGLDVLGNVVVMRSRFEDVTDAHRLLLLPLDSIESKFRSSYSMAVNILKTRDLGSAKTLVEMSFGNYLQMKRLSPAQAAASEAEVRLETIRSKLEGLDLSEAKGYRKLWERLQSEQRIAGYLEEQEAEAEQEIVETILPLSRMGAGLLLTTGETGALVGDYPHPHGTPSGTTYEEHWCLVLKQDGSVVAAGPQHVRYIDLDDDKGLSRENALKASIMLAPAAKGVWYPPPLDELEGPVWGGAGGGKTGGALERPHMLVPSHAAVDTWDNDLLKALGGGIPTIPEPATPGHVLRQLAVVQRVREQLEAHPLHGLDNVTKEEVLNASKDISALEDQVRNGWRSELKFRQPAWDDFVSITRVLIRYGALLPEDLSQESDVEDVGSNEKLRLRSTAFGDLVGGINADNELWLALVLTSSAIKALSDVQLAGLVPAIISEYSRPDMFNLYGVSEEVSLCVEALVPLATELTTVQLENAVDLPVKLDASLGGLVESWALGCDWAELCASTSLDQGDICRLLRRTMEVLRQIALLPGVDRLVRDRARRAVNMMDRFPVSDEATFVSDKEAESAEEGEAAAEGGEGEQEEGVELALEEGVEGEAEAPEVEAGA
ncbi:hypothetical protein JKP88DRAFT_353078 [Tribonema minus]|uniref:Uncharacterized protein n=1 Tax=Tribonema minus TaxID=303371 RepID=A0A835Z819_9STRA|nr:hypothetical protein JKP88DRAFT_353078 [Tribonema minus]